ncbi:MAG: YdbL family protein, partial [Sphingomonadaceae bacterium]|nr:YdbL family protein [Sphingomonadaceae bacterium]
GEQADGYLGIRGSVSEALRAEVDAINIKRRAAYTQRAAQKGATVKEVAAAVGCETLATRVASGRAYLLPDGVWRVKSTAPIALPSYCAG